MADGGRYLTVLCSILICSLPNALNLLCLKHLNCQDVSGCNSVTDLEQVCSSAKDQRSKVDSNPDLPFYHHDSQATIIYCKNVVYRNKHTVLRTGFLWKSCNLFVYLFVPYCLFLLDKFINTALH